MLSFVEPRDLASIYIIKHYTSRKQIKKKKQNKTNKQGIIIKLCWGGVKQTKKLLTEH